MTSFSCISLENKTKQNKTKQVLKNYTSELVLCDPELLM